MIDRRLLASALVFAAVGFGAAAEATPASKEKYLGSTDFACAKSLRIHGNKSVFYPPGKTEWASIPVPSDVVVYECGYRRARLICSIHTSRIMIRRASSRALYEVKCFGVPPRLPIFDAGVGDEGATTGSTEGAAPAPGAASPK